jgi:hypothetical protein
MTITAYLSEAGNWPALVGWRDHESGETVHESEGESIFLSVWCVLGLCMMLLLHVFHPGWIPGPTKTVPDIS